MAFTIYQASLPAMIRSLTNLSAILAKAVEQGKAEGPPLADLLAARLAPDMRPFAFQIQSACDTAKNTAARLTGTPAPSIPDTETTFPELQQRIATTLDYLKSFSPEQFAGAEDREIFIKLPSGDMRFTGTEYLTGFGLPNFFFHVTTAYALLRHKGIQIGKFDYLGIA